MTIESEMLMMKTGIIGQYLNKIAVRMNFLGLKSTIFSVEIVGSFVEISKNKKVFAIIMEIWLQNVLFSEN